MVSLIAHSSRTFDFNNPHCRRAPVQLRFVGMPIDDPIAQTKALIESDERQQSAGSKVVAGLLKLCRATPLLKGAFGSLTPLDSIADLIKDRREENIAYLLDVVTAEVQRISTSVTTLSDECRGFVERDWMNLVLDGLAKAQQIRAKDRIQRMAQVLAHAYFEGERLSPDLTEEMLRTCMSLDGTDVRVLAWLCDGMKTHFSASAGRVDHEHVNDFWGEVDRRPDQTRVAGGVPRLERLSVGELTSACAKLQSFGLVVQVRQNQVKVSPATLPYGPLAKGYQFLDYIRGAGQDRPHSAG